MPNVKYTIKFAIADNEDRFYDSAVFIQTNIDDAAVDLGADVSTCTGSATLNADIGNPTSTYEWFFNNTLIPGESNATLEANDTGIYKVEVSTQFEGSNCVLDDEVEVTLATEQMVGDIPNFEICDDTVQDGLAIFDFSLKESDILAAVAASNYDLSYYLSLSNAQDKVGNLGIFYKNTSNPQTVFVQIEDIDSGCLAYSNFDLIVKDIPQINTPSNIVVCDDGATDGKTTIDLSETTSEVINGDDSLVVTYHLTAIDAQNGASKVNLPYKNTFQNETLYINVHNAETGCSNFTTVDITVLSKPDIDLKTKHYFNSCDLGGDGFANFALNTIIDEVLQGLSGLDISFHRTLPDANNNLDAITNISNYQNSVANFETVYIRVVDPAIGCPSIAPIELHTNLAETGLNLDDNFICDDSTADGIAFFDLTEVKSQMIDGYEGINLTFFKTENDLNANVDQLDTSVDFEVNASPQKLFVKTEIGSCTAPVSVDLVINPPIAIQNLAPVDYCDTDSDGFTPINLNSFNSYVSAGINNPSVRYYISESNAQTNTNRLNGINFTNTSNPQQVFVRVTNTQTTCFDVASLTINVLPAPEVNTPLGIIICDDDQDGFQNVDLAGKISEIVSSTIGLDISFHETNAQAVNNNTPIATPNSFNTATQTIFVRVTNTFTGCFSIVQLPVIINTLPVFETIEDFENCELNGTVVSEYFFNLKDEDILNGQTGKAVLYFETKQNAIDRVDMIDKFDGYENVSVPQTIYVRVENLTDTSCFGISQFDLAIGFLPDYNEPSDLFICDDSSNDGTDTIALNEKVAEITNGIAANLTVKFYDEIENAENQTDPISGNYTNTNNPQEIFVRIDEGTNCFTIVDFVVNIIPAPDVKPFSNLVICDDDLDETVIFDITEAEAEITDVRIEDIEVSYHYSISGAETDSDLVPDPKNFTNDSNPQTVYIKVNDILSNCNVILPIELIVNTPPVFNDIQEYNGCDVTDQSIDLSEIDALLSDDTTNIEISYYLSQSDAIGKIDPLNTTYNYTSLGLTLFARLEDQSNGCFTVGDFELILNQLPVINVLDNLKTCDDPSNDGLSLFELSTQNPTLLGSQNPDNYTITYHESSSDAELGTNPLEVNYNGQGFTDYLRTYRK